MCLNYKSLSCRKLGLFMEAWKFSIFSLFHQGIKLFHLILRFFFFILKLRCRWLTWLELNLKKQSVIIFTRSAGRVRTFTNKALPFHCCGVFQQRKGRWRRTAKGKHSAVGVCCTLWVLLINWFWARLGFSRLCVLSGEMERTERGSCL